MCVCVRACVMESQFTELNKRRIHEIAFNRWAKSVQSTKITTSKSRKKGKNQTTATIPRETIREQ